MTLVEFVQTYKDCCVNDIPTEELRHSFDGLRHLFDNVEDELYSALECSLDTSISCRFQNGMLAGTMYMAYSAADRIYWPIEQVISYSELSSFCALYTADVENLL